MSDDKNPPSEEVLIAYSIFDSKFLSTIYLFNNSLGAIIDNLSNKRSRIELIFAYKILKLIPTILDFLRDYKFDYDYDTFFDSKCPLQF